MDDEEQAIRLDDQLSFALYAANNAFIRAHKPVLDALGLTYPQYLAMLCLWEENDLTIGSIGARTFLETNTLTPLLKRLEAAGLVRRNRNRSDERQVRVTLTEKGRALEKKAMPVPRQMDMLSNLDPEQSASLRAWLRWLHSTLETAIKTSGKEG